MSYFFILGAADPEMQAIEALLANANMVYGYATVGGARVHPGNAYKADGCTAVAPWVVGSDAADNAIAVLVECDYASTNEFVNATGHAGSIVVCDHHRAGDPGYGRPPVDAIAASSIGQVAEIIAQYLYGDDGGSAVAVGTDIFAVDGHGNRQLLVSGGALIAVADHCLAAAYAGQVPGIDPDKLMEWRVANRSAFQGRPAESIMADVAAAIDILRAAPELVLQGGVIIGDCPVALGYEDGTCDQSNPCCIECAQGWAVGWGGSMVGHRITIKDIRDRHVPELPEAQARTGLGFVSKIKDRDGRLKVNAFGSDVQIRAFMSWLEIHGIVDVYGDPARGFAGGYIPTVSV